MRRFAHIAIVALGTVLLVATLWAFRSAVILFLLSIVVGAALRPVADRLVREGWSLKLALTSVYLAAVGTVGVLAYVLGAQILVEIPRGAAELTGSYEHAVTAWPRAGGFRQFIGSRLPPSAELYDAIAHLQPDGVTRQALDITAAVLQTIGEALIVIVLSLYWSVDRHAFERLWLSLLPVERRVRARQVWAKTRAATGAHLRREVGQSVIAASALALGFVAVGCEYWGLPALLIAILRLVPLLGIVLAVGVAGLGGLLTGIDQAVVAASMTAVVLVILRHYVVHRLFDAPRLNPILAVVTVLGLASVYGFDGLLVAPLVAAAVQTIASELVATHTTVDPVDSVADLKDRLDNIERGALLVPLAPETASVFERLKRLVARVEPS